ncbi:hypothetical protein Y1Q_0020115 [Alligator mississippiensis]|uniref:Sushi domain-containing protein n=1 Tax=Alligator mississippiensis TaxID=8496 RepID=A0A151LZ09_ALLMI|nr:hypothetical protein Y1Q_0020115 [Alligator mississippiensis]
MKGQKSGKCMTLCVLAWSSLQFALSDAIGSMAAFTGAGTIMRGFPRDFNNKTNMHSNVSVQCTALVPPRYGSYYAEKGSGISLGSIIVYWCQEGYQLVGNGKLVCLFSNSTSYWSHPPPHCEVIPKPLDKGFRVAVIASLISGVIILTVTISFAVCCWRDRMLRRETSDGQQHSRTFRGRWKARSTGQERKKHKGIFGRLKQNRRLHYRISSLYSSAYPGAFPGRSNQGFQRSQNNLQKLPVQSLCSEIHIYPQVILHPSATPSASMYVHLPQKTGEIPLAVMPCHASFPRDLAPAYYRRYDKHKFLNKC